MQISIFTEITSWLRHWINLDLCCLQATIATNTMLYPKQFPSWRMHCSRSELSCCRNPFLKVWMTFPSYWRLVCQLT